MKLLHGMLLAFFAQILTFLQIQGGIKYGWYQKYPFIILAASVPLNYLFIESVKNMVQHYDGELWPSRLIGFVIGVIVFSFMSILLFKEPISWKTLTCLMLCATILLIQIFWK